MTPIIEQGESDVTQRQYWEAPPWLKALTTTTSGLTGGGLGLVAHGGTGLTIGATVGVIGGWLGATLGPSIAAFLIDWVEWRLGAIRARKNIPTVAPNPYRVLAPPVTDGTRETAAGNEKLSTLPNEAAQFPSATR
jgi:hypothetical protein